MNKHLACILAASSLLAIPLRAADPAPKLPPPKIVPFPQADSDLKPDPNARFGTLPNGLRYVILPNHEPRGRISLRLLVQAGSFDEKDDQQGLAHFLEHMAFNGSTHYPLDMNTEPPTPTLVEYLMRMGMHFGADTNANTGYNRTMYILELPHADDKTLSTGLGVFADDISGLLLRDDMINKERGIILSEKRVRDTVSYRIFVAEFQAMLGDTLLPKRLPIGQADIINTAKRDRFVDFWDTWYRPERVAVVVVGDFTDTDAVEKLVKAAYSNLTPRAPAKDDPSLGTLPHFDGVRPIYHAEPESPSTDVSITSITPYAYEPDTTVHELKLLPRNLAIAMLNRRLSILSKKEDAPFTSASASVSEDFNFFHNASIDVSCKPEQWNAALAVGEQELRRALKYGFTDAELKEATDNFSNDLDQAVKSESTRNSKSLAGEIAQSLVDRVVYTSPDQDLALFKPALEKITPADCLNALRVAFAANGHYVAVAGNVQIPGDANAAIAAAYQSSQAVAVAPPEAEKKIEWAYTNFGVPGRVVKRQHIDDLGIDLITFSNGVCLNIKKTDFEAGKISLNARIGCGVVTEPQDERGLAALAGATFDAGGLGSHSADDLQRLFAGKTVGVQFHPEADAFAFSGDTTKDDLLLEMQLLTAKITDPGYRPEALREARKNFEELYNSFAHTASGPLATEVANLIAGGDPRIGLPPKDVMMQRNLDEVRDWLKPQFEHGALEVAIVGDLDIDATIDAASKTIGALPVRGPRPDLTDLEKITFPAIPFVKRYTISSAIPKTQLALFWPTDDGLDIKRRRRLNVLAEVLSDMLRVRVREKIGGTYSPHAASAASETFPGYGYIEASIDADPVMSDQIANVAVDAADDIATHGVTDDQLTRVRLPLLTALKESLRSNGYWLANVLARAQEKPEMLDWARNRIDDVNSITTDEINAYAKQYLGHVRVYRIIIEPADLPPATTTAPAGNGTTAPGEK